MVSHKYKLIFVNIPWIVGDIITHWMKTIDRDSETPDLICNSSEYANLKWYRKYYGEKNYKSYFKFSFVRNPWDLRIHVKKSIANLNETHYRGKYARNLSFSDWIKRYARYHVDKTYITKSQNIYIDPLADMDLIGKFENLQQDFNIICDKIGIPQQQLPHINKTKHKHYTEYYDDETRAIVAEKYAKDIEYFNYEFGE